ACSPTSARERTCAALIERWSARQGCLDVRGRLEINAVDLPTPVELSGLDRRRGEDCPERNHGHLSVEILAGYLVERSRVDGVEGEVSREISGHWISHDRDLGVRDGHLGRPEFVAAAPVRIDDGGRLVGPWIDGPRRARPAAVAEDGPQL